MDRNGNFRQDPVIQRQATSVRQLSEWGMLGLQGAFPHLKDRILYEERGERRIMLELYVLLFNYRASTVGLNQIQSTYMPHLERSANKFMWNY
jgi:predicted component of type VI protein secretion system